jgi:anti-anti-sigma factor
VRTTLAGPHAVLVIEVEGELDLSGLGKVRVAADLAIDAERAVVLDLSECPFIDSAGLGLVADIDRELAAAGPKRLAVVVRDLSVMRAFSLAGLDRRIPLCAGRDEAIQLVNGFSPVS